MRIVSLVPSATEMLFELGFGDQVVGVTHECDWPIEALTRPRVTGDELPPGLTSAEIDAAVKERTERGQAIYSLDEEQLKELEPDLIVTQALCPVCAVSYEDVEAIAARMQEPPVVIALDPHTLGEVINDTFTLAEAAGNVDAADEFVDDARARIEAVTQAVHGLPRPGVAALEWLDPPYSAGHWVPQMIELAGGEDVFSNEGERSEEVTWELAAALQPDSVIVMPCGYGTERALEEANTYRKEFDTLGAEQIVAVDASAYFSRPGPRVVEGIELLARILHPDQFAFDDPLIASGARTVLDPREQ